MAGEAIDIACAKSSENIAKPKKLNIYVKKRNNTADTGAKLILIIKNLCI
mgnify:CR=1 FL=1